MTRDRDQSIERLLRRARSSERHAPGACPDAETLAALADDTLTAAARRDVDAHVADCHRCQALTAAMVRADTSAATSAGENAAAVPWWKGSALRWLVPAAAAATAVALWVAIPDERSPMPAQAPAADTQMAAAPPAAAPEAFERDTVQTPAGERTDRPAAPPPAAPAEAPLEPEESVALEARSEAVRGQDSTPAREQTLNEPAAPAAAPPAGRRVVGALRAGGVDVVSPNPQIRWQVGPGSTVQYSADGGATWMAQQTGASTDLTAGSSPAPEVCWLVGRGGLVLRTTDGGRQWERVVFPETVDLTAVAASSAVDAVVTLADGRRFRTTDGGRTWMPVRD